MKSSRVKLREANVMSPETEGSPGERIGGEPGGDLPLDAAEGPLWVDGGPSDRVIRLHMEAARRDPSGGHGAS